MLIKAFSVVAANAIKIVGSTMYISVATYISGSIIARYIVLVNRHDNKALLFGIPIINSLEIGSPILNWTKWRFTGGSSLGY